jgi:quercetin dioxygenase-like cupin family protein
MTVEPHDLARAFAVLTPDLGVETIDVTPSVFEDLGKRFGDFQSHVLVSCFSFAEDWPTWERHPAGDEIVILVTGAVTLHLELDSGEQRMTLDSPGAYGVVPKGVWHTASTSEATTMYFVTPGAGTENRAR